MGKHSVYHASGEPDGHRRTGIRFGMTENTVDPPQLPAALESKLAELDPGPVRDEFLLGVGRVGFTLGVHGLTPAQLDRIHAQAVQDVQHQQTRVPLDKRVHTAPSTAGAVVYYLAFGDGAVKIGTTRDLARRVREIYRKPEDVLVTEPGDARLEGLRHKQFATDRIDWPGSREVFRMSEALRSHIDMLIQHQANAA